MTDQSAGLGERLAGLAIAALGALAAAVSATSYAIGTAANMGPGYLPLVLGLALLVLGGLIVLRPAGEARLQAPSRVVRPAAMVLGAVLLFGAAIASLGVGLTGALTVVGAALGSREARVVETLLLAGFMMVAVSLLFVGLLGLPLKVWPL